MKRETKESEVLPDRVLKSGMAGAAGGSVNAKIWGVCWKPLKPGVLMGFQLLAPRLSMLMSIGVSGIMVIPTCRFWLFDSDTGVLKSLKSCDELRVCEGTGAGGASLGRDSMIEGSRERSSKNGLKAGWRRSFSM